ncbi:hypothetical protein BTVI_42328 [Pitangus sulphuratus]|nr:hypothetical protein BTVI_42328 [Pitangus sulphuratus]
MNHVQGGFEYLWRRRLRNLSGQPVPVLSPPQSKGFFPPTQMELCFSLHLLPLILLLGSTEKSLAYPLDTDHEDIYMHWLHIVCIMKYEEMKLCRILYDLGHPFKEVIHLVDQGKPVDVISLDLSKDFDTVTHRTLLDKLSSRQLDNHIRQWVHSWLSGWAQRLTMNGVTSEHMTDLEWTEYPCEQLNILSQSSNADKSSDKLLLESATQNAENLEGLRSAC